MSKTPIIFLSLLLILVLGTILLKNYEDNKESQLIIPKLLQIDESQL